MLREKGLVEDTIEEGEQRKCKKRSYSATTPAGWQREKKQNNDKTTQTM